MAQEANAQSIVNLTIDSFTSFSSGSTPTAALASPLGLTTVGVQNASNSVGVDFGDIEGKFRLKVYQRNRQQSFTYVYKYAYGRASVDGIFLDVANTGGSQLRRMDLNAPVKENTWRGGGSAFYTSGYTEGAANFRVGQWTWGHFNDGQPGYMGFRVANSGKYYYGWMRVQVTKDTNGRPLSIGFVADADGVYGAFNAVAGGDILAGQLAAIPEPATTAAGLALFALGAAGVREYRRRKAAA